MVSYFIIPTIAGWMLGYIDEKIAKSGISHTEIEVEFDRNLMEKDGLDRFIKS